MAARSISGLLSLHVLALKGPRGARYRDLRPGHTDHHHTWSPGEMMIGTRLVGGRRA